MDEKARKRTMRVVENILSVADGVGWLVEVGSPSREVFGSGVFDLRGEDSD